MSSSSLLLGGSGTVPLLGDDQPSSASSSFAAGLWANDDFIEALFDVFEETATHIDRITNKMKDADQVSHIIYIYIYIVLPYMMMM